MKIGILSDTHNLLRPEVIGHLRGCDAILHGGDISSPQVLDQLETIAPVKAVRGNNDGEWAERLPRFLDFELCGLRFYMTHKRKDLPRDVSAYDVVVYGHSHQYAENRLPAGAGGRRPLLLNPGSCGPRRFAQPITMAMLTVDADGWTAERIDISRGAGMTAPKESADIRQQIEWVVRQTQKGRSPAEIASRYSMDAALAEQIARLYVTHPGVTVDQIMAKMGI